MVGSGGREHALAWKLAGEEPVERVLAAPGSAGMAEVAECVGVRADDIDGLALLAEERGVDLTMVGPEVPLAAGLVDRFRERGLRAFGPDREGARLESSKAFAKRLLTEAGIPTAAYAEFSESEPARGFARELGYPVVVKADGLAAGKGVLICADEEQAGEAISSMLERDRFGAAGRRILVEEFLEGDEVSFMAISDGQAVLALASSQDHKPVFDGDRGPNTGGMGAYSPAPALSPDAEAIVMRTIIEPTVGALRERGIDYRGVLYAGLMMTAEGPKVLEYNVRFGDPECQPLMVRLRSNLSELAEAALDGKIAGQSPEWSDEAAVCVVMASEGYPGTYEMGRPIAGIEGLAGDPNVRLFHAGTARDERDRWITAGGRVLGVTATAPTITAAAELAYDGVARISWTGAHYRRDIAHRGLAGSGAERAEEETDGTNDHAL